jgi:hypothetical protein
MLPPRKVLRVRSAQTLEFESARVRVHAAKKHNLDRLRAEKENINPTETEECGNARRKTEDMIATPGKWGMVVYDGEVNRSMSNICQMKCQNPENMKRIEIGEDED